MSSTCLPRHPLLFIRPVALLAALLLTACATPPPAATSATSATSWEQGLRGNAVVLLGEIHDNAALHERRTQALERALATGWRPVIAMEQFDIDRQVDIERARAERPDDVDHLIEHAQTRPVAWDWRLYRPVIALALQYRLPLRAANLARREAARLVRDDYETVLGTRRTLELGLADKVDTTLQAAQEREVDLGHCGALPASILPGMARAQIARDAIMADVVRRAADRGVVLLAGNGHVRRDIGVPRWLASLPGGRVLAIGYLEPDAAAARGTSELYDAVVSGPDATLRRAVDPCAGLRR